MVDWWMDVALRIPVGKETHESFEVGRTDVKELGLREGRLLVALGRKPVLKFHKAAHADVVAVLGGHGPAGGIMIIQQMLRRHSVAHGGNNQLVVKTLLEKDNNFGMDRPHFEFVSR